jgi:hypothetical protein
MAVARLIDKADKVLKLFGIISVPVILETIY